MMKYLGHSEFEEAFKWSILLFVIVLPIGYNLDSYALLLVIAAWFFVNNAKDKVRLLKKHKVTLLLMFALHFIFWIGLLYSGNVSLGLGRIERTLGLFIFPIIILSVPSRLFQIKRIFIVLGLGLLAVAVISWADIIVDILSKVDPLEQSKYFFEWIYTDENLLRTVDIHPGYFVLFLVLFLITIICNHNFNKLRKNKVVFIFIILLGSLFLVETSSRIGFFSFIFLLIFKIFKKQSYKETFLYCSIICLMIILTFQFDYLSSKFDKLVDLNGNIGFERYFRWKEILDVFLANDSLFFGVGTGDIYTIYHKAYSNSDFSLALKENYNAHNQYLELLVGNGLLGLFVFFAVLSNFIIRTRLREISLTFFVIIMIFSFSESFLVRSKGVFFFSFFYSLLIKKYEPCHAIRKK